MKTHLSLPFKNKRGKILHITDTHLFANEDDSLLGINTNASFNQVINEIDRQNEDFDLIVATGDFVQDGSKGAYLHFAEAIRRLNTPCVWLQGNHDIYSNMQIVFEEQGLPEEKVILLGDKWLVIMLNSQVEGKAYGMLSTTELAFLSSTLANHPERYCMVFLHHHPIMSGCKWLDEHCLKNSVDLESIVKKYLNIKSIGWGHIHQKIEKNWHHCYVFSTPSTCVQFKPSCNEFCLATDPPGWRIIYLNSNGDIETSVHCLSNNSFLPDMSQRGY